MPTLYWIKDRRNHLAALVVLALCLTQLAQLGDSHTAGKADTDWENATAEQWDSIDYESLTRRGKNLDNDANYVAPTVLGCVDDDLYNCNTSEQQRAQATR